MNPPFVNGRRLRTAVTILEQQLFQTDDKGHLDPSLFR